MIAPIYIQVIYSNRLIGNHPLKIDYKQNLCKNKKIKKIGTGSIMRLAKYRDKRIRV